MSLIPTNLSASLSYLFNAHEHFEYPTAVSLGTVLLSVTLQLAALLAGYGIIGLAAVSIIVNLFTLGIMYYLVRTILFKPRWESDRKLMRWMFFESYPLMLNNLLANLFFKIDVLLLQPLTDRELEVLRLVAIGQSNEAIAETLVISIETVKKHLKNIYGKLDVHSRLEAVNRAREAGCL